MAVVKYGSIVTELIGKIGGHVYQKCGQSHSVRSNPSRKVSQSSFSLIQRGKFAQLASLWNSITVDEKQSFQTNAHTYHTFNKYGESTVLTAFQLFMMLNTPLVMAGFPAVTTAIAYVTPPNPGLICSTFSATYNLVELYNANIVGSDYRVIVYMSRPYPTFFGRKHPEKTYVAALEVSVNLSTNVFLDYIAKMPEPLSLVSKYYVEAWIHQLSTGCFTRSLQTYIVIE